MAAIEATRSVPFFNYQKAFGEYEEQFVEIFRDVLRRGAFILQKDLADFEANLAAYLGVKHAIGLGNATDALMLAWRSVGLQPGDEVIFPSHTMVASPASVALCGGVPVPVDCREEDGLIDPESVRKAITPKTKAIMPVQLNGRTARMDEIQAICDEHGLYIVEDSAQGLGSQYNGRFAGTFGKAGVFSFYPAKILGCMGDGGALITNDDEIAEQVRLLRDHGRANTGEVELWGHNSRLDNLQAAILDLQFKDYAEIIARRRAIAALYHAELGGMSQLQLPPAPTDQGPHFDTFQNFEIRAERRDDLKQHLRDHGVGTLIQWGGSPVHQFRKLGFGGVSLPVTERYFERCVMLPLNMAVSDEDVKYVCDVIRSFYGE